MAREVGKRQKKEKAGIILALCLFWHYGPSWALLLLNNRPIPHGNHPVAHKFNDGKVVGNKKIG